MVSLERIRVQPIASLDAVSVPEAALGPNGLAWDRRYAIVERTPGSEAAGRRVTGLRERRLWDLEAAYDIDRETVTVAERGEGDSKTFHLELDRDCFASWLSDYLGYSVDIVRGDEHGRADDATASGPTVASTGTLEAVAAWYDGIDTDEVCRRFGPTLVVGAPPFWEDRLYETSDRIVPFEIGPAALHGVAPFQPEAAATLDPATGTKTAGYRETFVERRRATFPDWATESRFDHYFRLFVETCVPDSSVGQTLSVGDSVSVGAAVPASTPAN